ncbi:ATP-grasp domain-containing protein [Paenisporosarcina sp. TG20]|uniref:ATP-grasp domain-containing protein n=1 Tax=Paenisporosarcina sp. TG20 TaxID=1211706 RepID=UPI0002D460AE|nr:ATP-grasp domain-containing protein [Paenisporosarcina sp. TG20]
MKTIVFIGTNKSGSSREAIKAAERLGFFIVLLTDRKIFIENRLDFPDVHQMVLMELTNFDLLKENISKIQEQGKIIVAVLSFIDPFVHVAAKLWEKLGLTIVSSDPLLKMENKILTRELLKDLPVSPYFSKFKKDESMHTFIDNQVGRYPLIVKTPDSTGSKDVMLVKNEQQLVRSINNFLRKGAIEVLIEEYLDGPQYLIEVCVFNGKVYIVAVLEQEIEFFERFIVTGYCLLMDIEDAFHKEICETVSNILERFSFKNGSCHLEMRRINQQWKLIEINPRISGGAMNRIVELGFGINLVEETIKINLGQEPNFERKYSKFVYAHYITIEETGTLIKVTGRNRCFKFPGIEEVYIKPKKGKLLHPPLSMGDRYGYVLASSTNKEDAIRYAKEAAKEISFYLEPI